MFRGSHRPCVWFKGDVIGLMRPMTPERIYAYPSVRQEVGRKALRRGPLIDYIKQQMICCLGAKARLPATAPLIQEWRSDLLGGLMLRSARGSGAIGGRSLSKPTAAKVRVWLQG
jgi:hypothetical protein